MKPDDRQRADTIRWLQGFVAPESITELRALHVHGKETHAGWFQGDQLEAMADAALRLEPISKGVYFVPNPLGSVPGDKDIGIVERRGAGECTTDKDIAGRKWLLIDIDPVRFGPDAKPLDGDGQACPTTDAEREAGWNVLLRCRATMEGAGFIGATVAGSGNGWHLCFPVNLPNDDNSKELHRQLLIGLENRCGDERAHVDLKTFNASRIWKVYGTKPNKGTASEARPARWAQVYDQDDAGDCRDHNTQRLRWLVLHWHKQDELRAKLESSPNRNDAAYGAKAMQDEIRKVLASKPGNRNHSLNVAAFSLGQLVGGGVLTREAVEQGLTAAALTVGLEEKEIRATLRSGVESGLKQPRTVPDKKEKPKTKSEAKEEQREFGVQQNEVATIDDLVKAGAEIRWLWPGWLQLGVLNLVAAEGGTGKTRFCADLLRRIRHALTWPDGEMCTLSTESTALWVVADNHHDEMVSLTQSFGIKDGVWINASKSNPYGGVSLDTAEELGELEARIAAVKPTLVIVDTVGNSTDKNLSKQEDAKAYYQPLQTMARRQSCCFICLTHLSADGKVLGRRAKEKVRIVLQMEKPDESNDKRRLWVDKSNSKVPAALGVTMGEQGNEYDHEPPSRKERDNDGKPGPVPQRLTDCMSWITDKLADGPRRVSEMRTQAEVAGFDAKLLYRARDGAEIVEYTKDGKKFWRTKDTMPDDSSLD